MKGKLHFPALCLDAFDLPSFFQKSLLRLSLWTLLAQLATVNVAALYAGTPFRLLDTPERHSISNPFLAPDLTIEATGPASAACGDTFSVNIAVVSGFADIASLQYSVNWNETQLKYVSSSAANIGGMGGDPALGLGNTANGELTYSWFDFEGDEGEDLPDGYTLLTITFVAITDNGTANVDITGTPLEMEVADNFLEIGTLTAENEVAIALVPVVVTCPADQTVSLIDAPFVLTGLPVGGTYSGTGVSGGIFDPLAAGVGTHAITYSFTNVHGCTNSCTFDITVELVEAICPPDMGVCLEEAPFSLTGATPPGGAYSGPGVSGGIFDPAAAGLGAHEITYDYPPLDPCTFTITVFDTAAAPLVTYTFPDLYEVNAAQDACSATVTIERPNIGLDCQTPVFDNYTVADCNLLSLAPVEGPANVNGTDDSDFLSAVPPLDVCDPSNKFMTLEFPAGVTVIPYTWCDDLGNCTTVNITVIVNESEPPQALCKFATLSLDSSGQVILDPSLVDDGSSDNCGAVVLSVSPDTFTCADVGAKIVVLTVDDYSPLSPSSTCTTTVTILDDMAPKALCPDVISVSALSNLCGTIADSLSGLGLTALPSGSPLTEPGEYNDNCGVKSITYILSGPSGTTGVGDYPIPGNQVFNVGVTTVTYTFRDTAANTTVCSFDVTVEDTLAPMTLNCPPDISVNANLGGCAALVDWTPPDFTDNCPGNISVTSTHSPGGFFIFGPTLVTYTAEDASGNIGICSFTVNVVDTQPPVANCQNISVSLDTNGVVTVSPAQLDNNSTDNCFYDYASADTTFNCTNKGDNEYVLIIVDGSGNTASATCTVTVTDDESPQITNCDLIVPAEVELDANCSGTLSAADFALNYTFTDNTLNSTPSCPLTFDVNVNATGFAPDYQWTCANIGLNSVILRVSDIFGNTAFCATEIIVKDVTAPIIIDADIVAPPIVTIECSDYDANDFATLGQITLADVTDACDAACNNEIAIAFSDVIDEGACANEFTVTRTWSVTDKAGNTTYHTQTFNVVDTQAPVISGVQTLVNLEANATDETPPCSAPYTVELLPANLSDNCATDFEDFDIKYEIDFAPLGIGVNAEGTGAAANANFPIGISTVTFTVADPCGNSSQVTVTVEVADVDGPLVNEPFANTFGNTQKVCDSTFTILNATGNCGNSFSWYRPFRADDNFLDCSFHDVTESISDPTVQSAIDISAPFVYTNPPFFSIHPTAFFPVGETVIIYLATDSFNNTTTCAFTVRVLDTQAPVITCPGGQTLSISMGCVGATAVPSYLNGIQITDNCPNNVLLAQNPAPGTLLSDVVNPVEAGQTFTVTMTAKDSFPNNLASEPCTFTVTLTDDEAPVPNEPFLPVITSFCGVDTIEAPSASDCNGVEIDTIYGTPSVTVIEILPPLVPGGPPRYVIPAGNYAITWSYTDPQNNTTTQLQNVQVLPDTNPPIAVCEPPFLVNLSAAGEYLLENEEIDNGSSDPDACGPITLEIQPSLLTCANLGSPVSVTLIVTDVAGNTAQCSTLVTVNDVTAPVLSPILANDTLKACEAIPLPSVVTASDTCDLDVAISFVQDTISFTNIYNYTIQRTWTAIDDSGNASTLTQIIVIEDTQAPVFASNTPDTLVVVTDANNLDCKDTASIDITPYLTDCDSNLVITNSRTTQGANYSEILNVGMYTLVFTAQDASNHTASHTIVLKVMDGTNPIAACINGVSVALQPSGSVVVTPQNINSNSTDNCTAQNNLMLSIQRLDPLGPVANSVTFTCSDADGVTPHPVKLYVKDEAGNESTCETFIIVQDNVPPTITFCPTNVTVQCDDDLSPDAQGAATGADNCNLITVEYADTTGGSVDNFCSIIYRTWRVLDQAGNSATCVQALSVQDSVKPVFSSLPPANISVNCSDTVAIAPILTATDNCDDSVAVTLAVDTIDVASGDCGQFSYTIERTWTAMDDCGNTSVFIQEITVTDDEAPQFDGLPDTLTLFSADFPPNLNCLVPVSLDASQYVSDCSPNALMTFSNNAPHGDGELDISGDYTVGAYSVTFSATDACGNTGQDSIVLQIIDNSIPTAICSDNVVIILGSNGQAVLSPDAVNSGSNDNCAIVTMFLSDSIFDCGDLGVQSVTLTVVDASGNSNFCTVNVEVVSGAGGPGFSLTAAGSPESYFGADDGSASAVATGGSGQFTFLWSNGATTPDITNLSAGVYTVTVVDTIGGCTRVDTAVVDAGAKITLTIGADEGCQGETISIPVIVDNFFDVTGFKFTLHVNEDTVGTILGVTSGSIHPAIADGFISNLLTGNNLGVNWSDTSLTLPNGTVLFSIDVQLGTAVVGSSSAVTITGTPVAILFTQDSSGFNVVTSMIVIENDSVIITCEQADDIEIGGDIQTWNNPKPVPGVEVTLTGGVAAMQTTGPPGTYLFAVPNNTNTTVKCFKETAGLDGITGADILLIKRHVLGLQPLVSPYQFVAADVSGEGNLSILDYSRIQLVALGLEQHIPGSLDWKFVPKSYVFPVPPLSLPFPDSISHLPATMSFLDDDFVAVRMGDVNGNIMPTFTGDDVDDRSETLLIRLDERDYRIGETITVPFKASDFTQHSGFQMTLRFDASVLKLESIEPGALPDMSAANFGAMRASEGLLTMLWVTPVPSTLPEGEVFFTLKFKALRDGASLAEVLRPSSDITRAEGYDRDGNPMKLDFEFVQPQTGVETGIFALHQNQPNPFNKTTLIGFQLPEPCEAQLRIFDVSGKMLAERKAQYPAGPHSELFNLEGNSGVLYYELVTPFGALTRKMVAAQ